VVVAARLGFENTYALAMRRADAERLGVRRGSGLSGHAPSLRVAGGYELFPRPEGRSIEAAYALARQEGRGQGPVRLYAAARGGDRAGGRDQGVLHRRADRGLRSGDAGG